MADKLVSVNDDFDLPAPVAARQAARLGDASTAEGRALAVRYTPASYRDAIVPLAIPTYDGDPSVGHPSVVHVPGGWNGYQYWMAFTPYPIDPRENPSIVASHDGVHWEVPAGLTNPVSPQSEATNAGYWANSDTSLLLLPDGTMVMYSRSQQPTPPARNVIWRKTSTDGINWSTATKAIESLAGVATVLSPAFVLERNGNVTMWSVNYEATPSPTVERRTSTDSGATFGAPTTCAIPANPTFDAWHVDVQLVGGVYHMLLNRRPNVAGGIFRLHYLQSTDGLNWTQDSPAPLPLTGFTFDTSGHYRSCLVPVAGAPLKFDIYITGMIAGAGNNINGADAEWRIGLLRDVDLRATPQPYEGGVWIPATQWGPSKLGTPNLDTIGAGRYSAWLLDDTTNEAISASVRIPARWTRVTYDLYWTSSSGAGNVALEMRQVSTPLTDGLNLDVQAGPNSITAPAPAPNVLRVTEVPNGNAVIGGKVALLRITRNASGAADTMTGDVAILGVMVRHVL